MLCEHIETSLLLRLTQSTLCKNHCYLTLLLFLLQAHNALLQGHSGRDAVWQFFFKILRFCSSEDVNILACVDYISKTNEDLS